MIKSLRSGRWFSFCPDPQERVIRSRCHPGDRRTMRNGSWLRLWQEIRSIKRVGTFSPLLSQSTSIGDKRGRPSSQWMSPGTLSILFNILTPLWMILGTFWGSFLPPRVSLFGKYVKQGSPWWLIRSWQTHWTEVDTHDRPDSACGGGTRFANRREAQHFYGCDLPTGILHWHIPYGS